MLMVAMVRIRIGQMGISWSLGMWRRRRSGGKGVGMDVDAVNGEDDKDRKSQAARNLNPELPPLSLPLGSTASASSSARLQGVPSATHLWEPYTPTITYTYECSFSSHYNVFESSHLVLTFSFGPKEPVLSEEDAVPTIGASAAGANLRLDPRVGQIFLGNSGVSLNMLEVVVVWV